MKRVDQDLGIVVGPLLGHDRKPKSRSALADERRIGADLVAFQGFDCADDLERLFAGLADRASPPSEKRLR